MRGAAWVLLGALLLASCAATAAAPAVQTITKQFSEQDRMTGRYQYVPIDVPPGTAALHIAYDYDGAEGQNVVDLGVFEPGPLDLGTAAFRGYSGGARRAITISESDATPGYVAGPLPPGRWHVLLGLYRVSPAGVSVTLRVETERTAPRAPAGVAASLAPGGPSPTTTAAPTTPGRAGAPSRWYVGALHAHTVHSDGTLTPSALMKRFRDAGFDFVAITDHNNTTHAAELLRSGPSSPLLIIGEEVTTPAGHASVWGLGQGEWIDFRVGKGDSRIRDLVAAARKRGAVFSINHPTSTCLGCGWEHEVVDGITGLEVSNGRHGEVDGALALWDTLLTSGRRITGVGSSDWHADPQPIDVAHARVYAPALTQQAILTAIQEGRVVVMLRPGDPAPEILVEAAHQRATIGDTITSSASGTATVSVTMPTLAGGRLVLIANGRRLAPVPLDARGHAATTVAAEPGYVRAELFAEDGTRVAIANPVYFARP
jgi:hypothetical protein